MFVLIMDKEKKTTFTGVKDLSVERKIRLVKNEISKLIIQNKMGKLNKTHLIKLMKKRIARLLTK